MKYSLFNKRYLYNYNNKEKLQQVFKLEKTSELSVDLSIKNDQDYMYVNSPKIDKILLKPIMRKAKTSFAITNRELVN